MNAMKINDIPYQMFFLFLFAGLVLAGCTRVVEIEPLSEPMIALRGWWYEDREFTLEVSNTTSSFNPEGNIRFLNEATVNLWEDGELLGQMQPGAVNEGDPDHMFELPGVFPAPGHTYRVEASAPGLPPVYAETYVPNLVRISAIRFVGRRFLDSGLGDSLHVLQRCINTLEIDIEDEVGVENFYELSRTGVHSFEDGRPWGIVRSSVNVLDPRLLDSSGLISDRTFADGTGTIRFEVESHYWQNDVTFTVALTNAPLEYVLHQRQYRSNQTSSTPSPFTEPQENYSNVIGGVGSVMCFFSVVDSIVVVP